MAISRFLMVCLAGAFLHATIATSSAEEKGKKVPAALDFTMNTLSGKEVPLSKYKGKVVMVVNVASKCGLTPQYEQLEALHEKYADKGLAIIGFPCNQFAGQEPGSSEDIQSFCKDNYGVEFDLFEKIEVNGDERHPLYAELTDHPDTDGTAGDVQWNFEKFLVGPNGQVLGRFRTGVEPKADEIVTLIETNLPD